MDRPVNLMNAADAMAAGVSVIYQDFALIPYLSAAENIFLGSEILNRFGLVDWNATLREARRPSSGSLMPRLAVQPALSSGTKRF